MKFKMLPFILCACLFVSACTARVDTPNAKIKGEGVEIDLNDTNNNGHCPPGHRMKGWC